MASAVFTVKNYSYNSQWQPGMDAALAAWNATATKASITKSSSSKNIITSAQFNATWFGYYTWYGTKLLGRTFTIELNAKTIVAQQAKYPGSGQANWVTGVFVHELGHALSLKDNPATSQSSIMTYRNDYTVWMKPQAYDISDVKSIYG